MSILHALPLIRAGFATGMLLALATAPAHAASVPVTWDGTDGWGVSQATAQSANSAGIPIVQVPAVQLIDFDDPDVGVGHALNTSSPVIATPVGSGPATVDSTWSATNLSDMNAPGDPVPDNLYLVFSRPFEYQIFLNGQTQTFSYDPADVGLTLSSGEAGLADWVLLLVAAGNPVYYPAVSLGTLAAGSTLPFQLFYTLDPPQLFGEPTNFQLGIPTWNLFFTSIAVPEPSTALLLLFGLGALAVARREHS
jgi:hypothetical protein